MSIDAAQRKIAKLEAIKAQLEAERRALKKNNPSASRAGISGLIDARRDWIAALRQAIITREAA